LLSGSISRFDGAGVGFAGGSGSPPPLVSQPNAAQHRLSRKKLRRIDIRFVLKKCKGIRNPVLKANRRLLRSIITRRNLTRSEVIRAGLKHSCDGTVLP